MSRRLHFIEFSVQWSSGNGMNVNQLTNLQRMRDALMSVWTIISEDHFYNLVESIPWKIQAILAAKLCSTEYQKGLLNNVANVINIINMTLIVIAVLFEIC